MSTARRLVTLDDNEAVAAVALRTNKVMVIYPVTPPSPMANGARHAIFNVR